MYMNGRGPMYRGFGPMGGPMPHRPMGFFPVGGLFLLPALMFGGWMVTAVVGGVLSVIAALIGGILSGLASLASGVFSGGGVAVGIVIGLAAYYCIRNRSAQRAAETETEE